MLSLLLAASFLNVPVERVYDGDTFFVSIPSVPDLLGANLGVRVSGIDSPELSDKRKCMQKKARLAKDTLKLAIGSSTVDLNFCFRDKYYRINCAVRVSGSYDIGSLMLNFGHAVPYSGGRKTKRVCK